MQSFLFNCHYIIQLDIICKNINLNLQLALDRKINSKGLIGLSAKTKAIKLHGDFPGGPVAENPPSNAGGVGLTPDWGTKISHATGQLLSPCPAMRVLSAATEPQHSQK